MNADEDHDLDWAAFRYLAGELRGRELADFEAQLASNDVAQQSLSAAMEMTVAISAAFASDDRPSARHVTTSRSRHWPLMQIAGSLAATLLVAFLSWAVLRGGSAGPHVARSDSLGDDPLQLALIWSETRQAVLTAEPTDWSETPWLESTVEADDDPVWGSADLPAWLLTAVSAAEEGSDRDGPRDAGEI